MPDEDASKNVDKAKESLEKLRSRLNELEEFTTTQEIRLDELTKHYEARKMEWDEAGDLLRVTGKIPDITDEDIYGPGHGAGNGTLPSEVSTPEEFASSSGSSNGSYSNGNHGGNRSYPSHETNGLLSSSNGHNGHSAPAAQSSAPPPEAQKKAVVVKAPRIVGPRRASIVHQQAPAPAQAPTPAIAEPGPKVRTAVIKNVDSADLSEIEATARNLRRARASRVSGLVRWVLLVMSLAVATALAWYVVQGMMEEPPLQPALLGLPNLEDTVVGETVEFGEVELTFGTPVFGQMQVPRKLGEKQPSNHVRDYLLLPFLFANHSDTTWNTSEFFERSECIDDRQRVLTNLVLENDSLCNELSHVDRHTLNVKPGSTGECLFAFPLMPGTRDVSFIVDPVSTEKAVRLQVALKDLR